LCTSLEIHKIEKYGFINSLYNLRQTISTVQVKYHPNMFIYTPVYKYTHAYYDSIYIHNMHVYTPNIHTYIQQ